MEVDQLLQHFQSIFYGKILVKNVDFNKIVARDNINFKNKARDFIIDNYEDKAELRPYKRTMLMPIESLTCKIFSTTNLVLTVH